MSTTLLRIADPAGGDLLGALAMPAGTGAGTVLIHHEWWGLNDDMRQLASRLAAEGFAAIALDSYRGVATQDRDEARGLMANLDPGYAVQVFASWHGWAKHQPWGNGRVAAMGFCLGGGVALSAACSGIPFAAVVPFYGLPPSGHATWSRVSAPILGHYGANDATIPVEAVRSAESALHAAHKEAHFEIHPAGHAFMRRGGPNHDEQVAAHAWTQTISFLRSHLNREG
jgi:carboxymethylenebutenolidase